MQVVTLPERPNLWPALDAPELNPGPELIYHNPVSARWWRALQSAYPDFHVALLDGARVVAHGRAILVPRESLVAPLDRGPNLCGSALGCQRSRHGGVPGQADQPRA